MKTIGGKIFWILLAVLFLGLLIVLYIIPGTISLFEKTSVVEYGEIILKTETEAYFVRDESVYEESDSSCAYGFSEGDRVRKESILFQKNGVEIQAGKNGVVSYAVDGYETVLNPETMKTISRSLVESWFSGNGTEDGKEPETSSSVSNGRNKIKLVDEEEWFLLFWTELSDLPNYSVGKTVQVSINGETAIPMTVSTVEREAEEAETEEGDEEKETKECVRIVLKTTRYFAGFQKERKASVSIVTADKTGLLLKNTAVSYVNNMEGVYVKQVSGDYTFVPVNVLLTDGTYSVVSEGSYTRITTEGGSAKQTTINAYDEILNTPPKEK